MNLIIADDHIFVREGLRELIENQADLHVIGEADDGEAAVRLCREQPVDIVIMDISMPGLNGIDATKKIKGDNPKIKVIILSMHAEKNIVKDALKAGANGYLLDQFLQDSTNKRSDAYGGSVENRARLMLEVVDTVVSVWGRGLVGVHLAPRGDANDMGDSNPKATFSYVAQELGKRKIAFICARESIGPNRLGPELKKIFGGIYIANEGFTKESAQAVLDRGEADAVAFGKQFIANPDLPRRFKENAILNTPDSNTFYASGKEGYTDYPEKTGTH